MYREATGINVTDRSKEGKDGGSDLSLQLHLISPLQAVNNEQGLLHAVMEMMKLVLWMVVEVMTADL